MGKYDNVSRIEVFERKKVNGKNEPKCIEVFENSIIEEGNLVLDYNKEDGCYLIPNFYVKDNQGNILSKYCLNEYFYRKN
jgi:hypothetical protein